MRSPAHLLIAFVFFVGACGGGAAETSTTAAPATTTADATTTTEGPEATTSTVATTGDATFEFEGEVQAGTEFDITWTGPDNEGDFITIVPAGAREGTWTDYFYTADGSTGTLSAPTTAGDHEIRYLDASNTTVASTPIVVAGRVITLVVPAAAVPAGTEFDVSWEAIEAPGDYLTVVPAASAEGTSDPSYFYTADGPTGTLVAPISDGEFEIRYISGLDSATMAASSIEVAPLDITLEAPTEVAAGSDFEVTWTGPDGPSDYLTIVPADADEGVYASYTYTTDGSPLTLTAPEVPGSYEIRYQSDRLGGVFASIPITVE